MSTNRIIRVAPKLREEFTAPVSQYLHFKLHADTESDVTVIRDYGNTGIFTDDLFSVGGSSHTYSGGQLSLSGDQDGAIDSAALLAFLDLSTLNGIGGLGIMFDLAISSSIVGADQTIFDMGQAVASGEGGYAITLSSGDATKFAYKHQSDALATATSVSDAGIIGFYVDATIEDLAVVYGFKDSVVSGAAQDLAAPLPSGKLSRTFAIGARQSGDAAVDRKLNSDGGPALISDARIIRFEYDGLTTFTEMFAEYYANPREAILASFAGK